MAGNGDSSTVTRTGEDGTVVSETQTNRAARSTVRSHIGRKPTSVRAACHSGWVSGVRSCTMETRGVSPRPGPIVRAARRTSAPQASTRRGSAVWTHARPRG